MASNTPAREVLDREFLVIRSRLIDLAAALDRIERADGSVAGDARLEAVRQSLNVLLGDGDSRAEQLQMIFSLPYEEDWQRQYGLEDKGGNR